MMRFLISTTAFMFFSSFVYSMNMTEKMIAVTVDDVPTASSIELGHAEKLRVTHNLVDQFAEYSVPAVGFVNEQKLYEGNSVDKNIGLLEIWLDAGLELGNHTFDHIGMHGSKLRDVKTSVIKGGVVTERLSKNKQLPYRYFRHPYTQTGDSVSDKLNFESFLAEQGLTSVPFTIEHTDYMFSCVYDHLVEEDKRTDWLVQSYLNHLRHSVEVFETMSDEMFDRQIPQIWLIHANQLNAATLSEQLELLSDLGYQFTTIEKAMSDQAYSLITQPSGKFGPSWLFRWAKQLKRRLSVYGQSEPDSKVVSKFKHYCG